MSGAIPILPLRSGAQTVRWWERLGFTVEFEHRFAAGLPLYLGLRRGEAQVHLSEHAGDAQGPGLVYLWVLDVDAVATEFGVPVEDNDWGRDCQLTDPDGNRVRVGTAPRD